MLNKKERLNNKSKGPWGMKSYNFTYCKAGEDLERNRFITSPTQEAAEEQFNAIMDKLEVSIELVSIEEIED